MLPSNEHPEVDLMVLVIDNYDSFTRNLVSYFNEVGEETLVRENDKTMSTDPVRITPSAICISPGPGSPIDTKMVRRILKRVWNNTPVLGICLGHQVVGEFFGRSLFQLSSAVHGKVERVYHNNEGVFSNIPQGFHATRYHSLALENNNDSDKSSIVTAWTTDGKVMGIRHHNLPIEGIQFHPESLFTQYGKRLIRNFVKNQRVSWQ